MLSPSMVLSPPAAFVLGSFVAVLGLAAVAMSAACDKGTVPTVVSLTVEPAALSGGQAAQGIVTLNTAAFRGGIRLELESDLDEVRVPGEVLVPYGESRVTFPIETSPVQERAEVEITAWYDEARVAARLQIDSPRIASVEVSPGELSGGASANGTVTLASPAPSGGLSVELESDRDEVSVPEAVIVPAGEVRIAFVVESVPVTAAATVTVTASSEGNVASTRVRLLPSLPPPDGGAP